jgi:hypothetical protein
LVVDPEGDNRAEDLRDELSKEFKNWLELDFRGIERGMLDALGA